MPDSLDPRAAFIFEGIGDDEVIGDFGLALGGAAGLEIERYDLNARHAAARAAAGHRRRALGQLPGVHEDILFNYNGLMGTKTSRPRRHGVLHDARRRRRCCRPGRSPGAARSRTTARTTTSRGSCTTCSTASPPPSRCRHSMTEKEQLTWKELGEGSRALAEMVHASGYEPDMVLAIARGGLLVAGAMGYALGVKNVFTVNVEFYTGRGRAPRAADPAAAGARCDRALGAPRADLRRRRRHGRDARARAALLRAPRRRGPHRRALREAALGRRSDYVWRRTDRWITFAWSAQPPVGSDAATHAG